MSDDESTKVVQTELASGDYKQLKALAGERDLSLKAALEEAAKIWLEEQQQVDPNDPLIKTLEQIDAEPPVGEATTPAGMEADLYGDWRDSDEESVDDENQGARSNGT